MEAGGRSEGTGEKEGAHDHHTRMHRVWFVPRTAMCSIFWLSNIFVFTGIILLVTGKHLGPVYRSWGSVMLGIGFCLLLICLIFCVHAYCIITVDHAPHNSTDKLDQLPPFDIHTLAVLPNNLVVQGTDDCLRETCFDEKLAARFDPPSYHQCTSCSKPEPEYSNVPLPHPVGGEGSPSQPAEVWQPVAPQAAAANAHSRREQFSQSRMSDWLHQSSGADLWRPTANDSQMSCDSQSEPARPRGSLKTRSMTVDEARMSAHPATRDVRRNSQPAATPYNNAAAISLTSARSHAMPPAQSSVYDNLQYAPLGRDTVRHVNV